MCNSVRGLVGSIYNGLSDFCNEQKQNVIRDCERVKFIYEKATNVYEKAIEGIAQVPVKLGLSKEGPCKQREKAIGLTSVPFIAALLGDQSGVWGYYFVRALEIKSDEELESVVVKTAQETESKKTVIDTTLPTSLTKTEVVVSTEEDDLSGRQSDGTDELFASVLSVLFVAIGILVKK